MGSIPLWSSLLEKLQRLSPSPAVKFGVQTTQALKALHNQDPTFLFITSPVTHYLAPSALLYWAYYFVKTSPGVSHPQVLPHAVPSVQMLFSAAFFAELLLSLQDLVLTPFIRPPPKTWPIPLAPTSQQVTAFHFITWIMLPHSCLSLILIYRLVVSTAGTGLLSSLKSLRKKKTQYVHVGYSVNGCWGKE